MPKHYRVRNWKEYNEALVKRGSITFWFDEAVIKQWQGSRVKNKRGRPRKFSDEAIICGLTMKAVFRLSFRATQGFISSLVNCLKLKMAVPDYTLLCKRQKGLLVRLPKKSIRDKAGIDIVVDTTGLKVFGEGEWKVRQQGYVKHRLWRKLHLAVNSQSQEIESYELTDLGVQDSEGFNLLLKSLESPINKAIGDGTYDRFSCYEEASRRKFRLVTPPQRNARTSEERKDNKKKASFEAVQRRDETIREVREQGRAHWKIKAGYHRRSLAETAIYRIKNILGSQLSTKLFEHQKTEVAIWCRAINKMTSLGMPKTITL